MGYIKVDNDRHGRIIVVDVRLEESLNCANLKGVFAGDIIVDLNNIELALPMNNLELFFDEIKSLRNLKKEIRVGFFPKK